jgi:hypothetical protein
MYVLLGIRLQQGTSFTPRIKSHSDRSSEMMTSASAYYLSEKMRSGEG